MARPKNIKPLLPGEVSDEVLAAVLDADSEPLLALKSAIEAAGKDCGLEPKVIERLLYRMRSLHQPLRNELKAVKTHEFVALLEDRAMRALEFIDDYSLAKGSAKDNAIVAGIMLEKRNLLRGEPTHILSTTERMQLDELVPIVMKEALRRGITLEANEAGVFTVPISPERQRDRQRGGGQSLTEKGKRRKLEERDLTGEPA